MSFVGKKIYLILILGRFRHTHCRVGYDHGPQVPDPRQGQWLKYMEGHERWWDAIWAAAKERGDEEITMTPEHGPPNYQDFGFIK